MCKCLGNIGICIFQILNIAIFICGAALLGVGIWLLVDDRAIEEFNNRKLEGITLDPGDPLWIGICSTLITLGAFMFLVGFFGCCGVRSKNQCLICSYIIFVSVTLVLLVTAIVLAVVFNSSLVNYLGTPMAAQVRNDYGPDELSTKGTTGAWNLLQYEESCCGGFSYKDYRGSTFSNASDHKSVPYSCCKMKWLTSAPGTPDDVQDLAGCRREALQDPPPSSFSNLHSKGCAYAIKSEIEKATHVIVGLCAGILVVQIFGLVIACVVRNSSLKKENVI